MLLSEDIHRSFKTSSLILLLSMLSSFAATAQSSDTASDSIVASDTTDHSDQTGSSPKINLVVPDTIIIRSVPDSIVENFKRNKDFEYANDPAYLVEESASRKENMRNPFWDLLTGEVARVLVYTMLIGALLFAIYRIIVDNKLYLFYSKPRRVVAVLKNESDNEIPENIEEKIKEALVTKNYRLAVRYMHLKALKLLDSKELIRFHAQSTDHSYTSQLRDTAYVGDFRILTNVYEHVWFGGFRLTEEQAEIVRQNFNRFYSEIKN